jgi:hypothetical protein
MEVNRGAAAIRHPLLHFAIEPGRPGWPCSWQQGPYLEFQLAHRNRRLRKVNVALEVTYDLV